MLEPWLVADNIDAYLDITNDTVYTCFTALIMPTHKIGYLRKYQASEVKGWVRGDGSKTHNVNDLLGDDLKSEITPRSKVSIAASTFSIFAFEALRKELVQISELEFIFTSPAFVTEKVTDKLRKERREFFIPPRKGTRSRDCMVQSLRSGYATDSLNVPSPRSVLIG